MKKLITLVFAAVMMTSFAAAQAGSTANGTLSVNAIVTGSISLVFNTDTAGGVPLSANGQSTATLAFGNVSAFGPLTANVSRTVNSGANTFTVSTPVDVFVSKFNSTSATYKLTAQLGTADTINNWSVGGVAVGTTAATITTTGAYATNNALAVAITIPFATPNGTTITNTINYTATSN